jgi:PAS domain S-box-containing protein
MQRSRLSIQIPLLLILSSVAGSTLLFWQETRVANRTIQQAGIDNLHASLTHLQNMLNTQLAADSLEDARLSLSVSALHPGIRTLLLADENNSVMLANRYIWEGSPAPRVSGYVDAIARQVRQIQASSISLNGSLLHGYFPVTLRLVAGGLGVDRVGVLFVEYDLAPQFAQAKHNAMVQASLVGGLMLVVAIAVAILLHLLVSRRVKKIVEVSQRFAAGDLDARVQMRGHDELTELGRAFDDMADQRKKAQEVMRENEQFLETLFEHIPNMLFVKDAGNLKFLRFNAAGEKLLGYSRDELMGKNDYDFFPKAQADFFTSKDREIIDSRELRDIPEEPINTRYLGQRLLHTKKIPILADDGTPLYLLGISEDITERKHVESMLVEREHEFRTLAENSPDVIVRYDKEGRRIYVNPEFERVNRLSAKDVLGKKPVEISTELAPSADEFTGKLMAAMASGTISKIDLSWNKDGKQICWYVRVVPEFNANGEVVSALTIWSDITERKNAEFVLRQSEEALKEAQRLAHVGSWHMDLATNQVVWSEELYKIYGFDPALPPPLYTESMKLFTPESWERLSTSIARATETGIPYELELEMVPKEGGNGWMWARGELVRDERGVPVRVRGVVMDITRRKLDEQALHRLNRELRAISNCNETLMRAEDEQSLLDAICHIVCDEAGYRMAWVGYPENDAAKTVRPVAWAGVEEGYLAQASITWADTERGRGPSGIAIRSGKSACFHDFSTDPNAAPWRDAALQRGYRSSISMPLKDEGARTFGILTIYSSEPNAFTPEEIRLLEELAGDMAFGIMVLRARIERKCAEESLRLMNERYALSTRAARLGVWDWDLQRNELVWDDRMYELYGVKREDFAGAYEAWLQGIHPDDRAASDEISKQAQRGEREYDTEFRVVWPDGSIHYLKAYGQFVKDAEGKPVRMTGVNYDITELKEAEHKVTELNRDLERRVDERTAQLEAANKELEAFSYSVSHDLRTPLRAIDGFSHILLEDYAGKLDDEGKRLLNVVRNSTSRMGQLIDDILQFSRSGRLEMTLSEIDMKQLAQEVYAELQPSAADSKLQLEIESIPPARGDRSMMRQVLVNLLSNSIKFSRTSEIPKVLVGASVNEDETIYFVKDNGVGFDMRYVDKLFGVFQRLHSVNEFEGTGIGLAIVKRIVNRHGGRVWAEGKVNEGATIYFALPKKGGSHA